MVKSAKIFLRDSGILHRLLNVSDFDALLGHPLAGASWEGFVAESIINNLSDKWRYSYYRSATQAEIDLVLEGPVKQVWGIEIKRSAASVLTKGFHQACEDIKATQKFVVYAGTERYPMANHTEAIGLIEFLKLIREGEVA